MYGKRLPGVSSTYTARLYKPLYGQHEPELTIETWHSAWLAAILMPVRRGVNTIKVLLTLVHLPYEGLTDASGV